MSLLRGSGNRRTWVKPRANEVEDTTWSLKIVRNQKPARAESRNISHLLFLDVNREEDKNLET